MAIKKDGDSGAAKVAKGRSSKAVPTGRASRFARVAKLASGVAGGMLAEGTRQLRAGKRLRARDLLLTPGNAKRVTDQLADMRGAAMKLGQILSMDTGDLLPKELTDILARLRSDARTMPIKQLRASLVQAYGEDWEDMFYGFDVNPIAAASIGQVHRTTSPNGADIVLKVQYPGVADSIDNDVDNISAVLRISGLIPKGIDLTPLLDDAKLQLKDEADYLKEAEYLQIFAQFLADDERFVVPRLLPELTHKNVLAMSYESGQPIESLADQPQEERDRVMSAMLDLMLTELFELRMVQTDPNFANYQYRSSTGEIVLLDFGATRKFKAQFVKDYASLAKAGISENRDRLAKAADKLGYSMGDDDSDYRELVVNLFMIALEPMRFDGEYDFGHSDMPARLSKLGEAITDYRDFWRAPPIEAVYFHRKVGGMFMLASRLRARVNVRELMLKHMG